MFGEIFRRRVKNHPERLGCPVAAAALARPEDPELAAAATAAFQSWEAADRRRAARRRRRRQGRRDLRRPRRLDRRGRPDPRPRRRRPGAARLGDRRPRPGARRAARRPQPRAPGPAQCGLRLSNPRVHGVCGTSRTLSRSSRPSTRRASRSCAHRRHAAYRRRVGWRLRRRRHRGLGRTLPGGRQPTSGVDRVPARLHHSCSRRGGITAAWCRRIARACDRHVGRSGASECRETAARAYDSRSTDSGADGVASRRRAARPASGRLRASDRCGVARRQIVRRSCARPSPAAG